MNNASSVRLEFLNRELHGLLKSCSSTTVKDKNAERAFCTISEAIQAPTIWAFVKEASSILKSGEVPAAAQLDTAGTLITIFKNIIAVKDDSAIESKLKKIESAVTELNNRLMVQHFGELPQKVSEFEAEYGIKAPVFKGTNNTYECSAVVDYIEQNKLAVLYTCPTTSVRAYGNKPFPDFGVGGKQLLMTIDKTESTIEIFATPSVKAEFEIDGQIVQFDLSIDESPMANGPGRVLDANFQHYMSERYDLCIGHPVPFTKLMDGKNLSFEHSMKLKEYYNTPEGAITLTKPPVKVHAVEKTLTLK